MSDDIRERYAEAFASVLPPNPLATTRLSPTAFQLANAALTVRDDELERLGHLAAVLSRAHALAERLAAEGEERASQAVTAEQAAAWKTQAHVARLFLAALDTDPGREPASPRHTRAEEEK